MSKKSKGVNADLEKAINELLRQTMADPEASLTDKTKILDRALKLEMIKQKASDDSWGEAFSSNDDDE